jgi:sugar-specific transcriptional regulator TrmB
MNKGLGSVLQRIGLTDRQSEVYLASLSLGPSSVLSLSRHTGMHRPMLYKLLDEMVDAGAMMVTISGKRQLYVAAEPRQLMGLIKAKEELLKGALPELLALANLGTRKPKIEYYEGDEQLRSLYHAAIDGNPKEILTYFPSKYMAALFGKREMVAAIRERVRRGIRSRTLRAASSEIEFEGSEEREVALRDVRYLGAGTDPGMGIIIARESVYLFSPIEEGFGMRIESKSYAALMRCFFEALWAGSAEA